MSAKSPYPFVPYRPERLSEAEMRARARAGSPRRRWRRPGRSLSLSFSSIAQPFSGISPAQGRERYEHPFPTLRRSSFRRGRHHPHRFPKRPTAYAWAWRLKRRGLYQCKICRRQVSVTAGTAMHRTKLPLRIWFWAIFLVARHKKGISAMQLQSDLGTKTYATA